MRYTVIARSQSGHCCFDYTVVDTTKPVIINGKHYNGQFAAVCECFDKVEAEMVSTALNVATVLESEQYPLAEVVTVRKLDDPRPAQTYSEKAIREYNRVTDGRYKAAYLEWMDKTEFVQARINGSTKYLGWHRADIMRDLIQNSQPTEPCATCNENGEVGNILNAEPCPDCTPQPAAPVKVPSEHVNVSVLDIKAWRNEWLEENDPRDGTDCVTPFDKYLYGQPAPGKDDCDHKGDCE